MEMIDCVTDVEPRMVSAKDARIVVTPHPMTTQGQTSFALLLEDGEYLSAILDRQGVDAGWIVELGGLQVPALMWGRTRVKHGVVIECRRAVHDNNTLRIAATIALIYFAGPAGASAAAAYGGSAAAWSYAIVVAGTMVINSVLPPSLPAMMQAASNDAQPTYSLSGGRNSSRLWEPMSLVLGQPYVVPDLAGQPWSYYSGEDQYLTQVFHGGINLQKVDTLRIGQTLLSAYEGVTVRAKGLPETSWPSDLPANSVDTISGALLDAPTGTGTWVVRTTSTDTTKIGIDLEMSLFSVNSSSGAYESRTVDLEVEYAVAGSGVWLGVPTGATYQEKYQSGTALEPRETGEGLIQYVEVPVYSWRPILYASGKPGYLNASTKPLRIGITMDVAKGQYDVRLRKITKNETSTTASNVVTWTQLKSFQPDLATYPGQSLVALTIKASGQLSGALDQLNWIATARPAPYWNGSAWVTATNRTNGLSNPATQILQLARGIYDENGKLIAGLGWADSRIDIESIKAFSVWCAAKSLTFDAIIQTTISHDDLFSAIAYAGMGTISWSAGKFGVQWLSDTAPIEGVINMGNIKAKSFSVAYSTTDRADEIEYGYFDRSSNNQWNSLRVLSPNVTMPNNTARLSNLGITTQAQAALLARYAMAQNVYMAKAITFEQDLEYMTYKRGTVLALSHDMTQWGYSGRIQSAVSNAGVITLGLDDLVPTSSGSKYIGLRLAGETQYRIFTVSSVDSTGRSVTLSGAWPSGVSLPTMDTVWIYDFKSTPGQKVVVTKIEPSDNQGGAKVTVAPLPDEFWPYVLTGAYTAPPNRSLLSVVPAAASAVVTEQLNRQGNTFYVDLNLSYEVTGAFAEAEIWGGVNGSSLHKLGVSTVQSFKWVGGLGESWNVEVRPKNSVGQAGATARVSYSIVGLSQPPSDVQALAISVESNGVRATWSQCFDIDYSETSVRIGTSWAAGVEVLRKSATSHLLGWQSVGTLQIWAKHFDTTGNQSVNAVGTSIVIANPNQVQFTRTDVQVNTVALGWGDAKSSQPIKSYSIYTGNAGDALSACTLYGKAGSDSRSDVVIFRSAGKKRIYLVAEDVAGNLSEPSSIDVNVALPSNFVISSEWDENWTGTRTNAYVDGGYLFMPVNTTETWADHFSTRGWSTINDQVSAGYPLVFEPSLATGSYVEEHDVGKILPSVKITVTVQSITLAGSVLPTVLIEWRDATTSAWIAGAAGSTDLQATKCRYVRVTYSITSSGGDDLIKLSPPHVVVSSEEKAEYGSLVLNASDASGTLYTCNKSFLDIVSAIATANNSPSIAKINVIIDDSTSVSRVYVQAWDSSNNRCSGSVSLQIGGY
jgi:hypothetical protein